MSWPGNEEGFEERRMRWQARYAESDAAAGIETTADFMPFRQIDDVFTRAFWDERVRTKESDAFFNSYRADFTARRGDGFNQRDFALRNASWLISDLITNRHIEQGRREGFQAAISDDTPVVAEQLAVDDPAAMAAEIKKVARFFGARLCGITEYDERWTYESRVDVRDFTEAPVGLPEGLEHVIVLGHEMDEGLVTTYPSALAGAATGREYSHEAAIVMQTAAYIRALGYRAVASMNDTALAISLCAESRPRRICPQPARHHPGDRTAAALFQDFHGLADGARRTAQVRGGGVLFHLYPLRGRLPCEGPALRPAECGPTEPVRHPGRG